MSRRKGEMTPRGIDREWPYQVEFAVPPRGLGNLLGELHQGAADIDPDHRTRSRICGPDDYFRFCFRSVESADEFSRRFGGRVVGEDGA